MPQDYSYTVLKAAARIVASYVSYNQLATEDLPTLIVSVFNSLREAERKPLLSQNLAEEDYIICLEDGRKFRSLTRHLRAAYNMSPGDYREKWLLPNDYPMTAPGYSKLRREIAKNMQLGTHKREIHIYNNSHSI